MTHCGDIKKCITKTINVKSTAIENFKSTNFTGLKNHMIRSYRIKNANLFRF